MQSRFGFCGHDEILRWHAALAPLVVADAVPPKRTPIGALVKSLISGRTRDPVSLAAYHRLRTEYGSAAGIAGAEPREVERTSTT